MEAPRPTDALPIIGFLMAYTQFSVLTKHVALLFLLNRGGNTGDALLACIGLDLACRGWVGLCAYTAAAAAHAALYYSRRPDSTYWAGCGYCLATAATDPFLAVDLAAVWWVSRGMNRACQNALAFVGLRRVAVGA